MFALSSQRGRTPNRQGDTHTLVRSGIPSILNPFDEFAVEEAVRIREKHGGNITVITMSPLQAKDALVRSFAMGADRACPTLAESFYRRIGYRLAA